VTTVQSLLAAFERHDVGDIRALLNNGFDVHTPIAGKSPVTQLVEMYLRSDRFVECLRLLLDRGAMLDDPVLAPVLLNDSDALRAAVRADPALLAHRTNMASAFTPLAGASLLHIAAEYGHLDAARTLLDLGAAVDARAAVDTFGFNGHTPLFHTVNSNANRSAPVMRVLLDAGAQPDLLLPGITWGAGFDWETTCFDVTPVAYAQLGLLRQMQRSEADTYDTVRTLLRAAGRAVPPLSNVPNRYLSS
jgi:Ankyrin repeat